MPCNPTRAAAPLTKIGFWRSANRVSRTSAMRPGWSR